MMRIFKEVQTLREEGKLHQSLIFRIWLLFGISLATGAAVLYNIFFHGAEIWLPLLVAVFGFGTGFFLFSRMNAVRWDEKERVLTTGRLDIAGIIVLVFYVVFEFGLRAFLKDFYPAEASVVILAAIFGTLLGRAVGTVFEIHRVYRATRLGK